jgi:hypothetical protein
MLDRLADILDRLPQMPYWLALGTFGGFVVAVSLAAIAAMIFLTGDPHAGLTPRIFVCVAGVRGAVYGFSQIRKAVQDKRSHSKGTPCK